MFKAINFVKPVVIPSVLIITALLTLALIFPNGTSTFFGELLKKTTDNFGWLYLLSVAIFLGFMLAITFTKMGNIKLGPDHAQPEYSYLAWFGMLFSVGAGISIIFYGAYEPVLQYIKPPEGEGGTIAAAKNAIQISFFHWGFHVWAIYGVVGMILAYFSFRHGLPLSLRTPLRIFFGDKMDGILGHIVDTFAVLCTLFGVSTSIGLSVVQVTAGLNYVNSNFPLSFSGQFTLICAIAVMALLVIKAGMDKGVKLLTTVNITLVIVLMTAVFILGPTRFILQTFFENTGQYLNTIIARTFDMQSYTNSDWTAKWTLFIFAWIVAWSPVIGLFVAKISRGRTIREFVLGVLIVPSLLAFIWFTVFGNTALDLIINKNFTQLTKIAQESDALTIFTMYSQLNFSTLLTYVTIVVLITCFLSVSISGPLMLDAITAKTDHTPFIQKGFWTLFILAIAAVLLYTGGIDTLKSVALISALPFIIIILFFLASFIYALRIEYAKLKSLEIEPLERENDDQFSKRIAFLIEPPNAQLVENYIFEVVYPAMQRITTLLNRQEWPCIVTYDQAHQRCFLQVKHKDLIDFHYGVRLRMHDLPEFSKLGRKIRKRKRNPGKYATAEVFLRQGGQDYNVYAFSQEEIMDDILKQFERELTFIETSPGLLPWKIPVEEADIPFNQLNS